MFNYQADVGEIVEVTYDDTFPKYADRMISFLVGFGALGAVILFVMWGWKMSAAWILGTVFHVAFFLFLKVKYVQWMKAKRPVEFIGRRLTVFTASRFIVEIALAILVISLTPLNMYAFLAGLLSLPFLTFVERAVSVIKE